MKPSNESQWNGERDDTQNLNKPTVWHNPQHPNNHIATYFILAQAKHNSRTL